MVQDAQVLEQFDNSNLMTKSVGRLGTFQELEVVIFTDNFEIRSRIIEMKSGFTIIEILAMLSVALISLFSYQYLSNTSLVKDRLEQFISRRVPKQIMQLISCVLI